MLNNGSAQMSVERLSKLLHDLPKRDDCEFNCPNTGIPLRPKALRIAIVAPADTSAVLELLDGTLNRVDCSCGSQHTLETSVFALHEPSGELVLSLSGAPEPAMRQMLDELGPPFNTAALVADYDALRGCLLGWLDMLLTNYALQVLDGTFATLPRPERIVRRLPALLVYLRDHGEGRLPAQLVLEGGAQAPAHVATEFHARLYVDAVIDQLDDLMDEADLAQMIVQAAAHIPPRAIGDAVMERLAMKAAECLEPLLAGSADNADVEPLFFRAIAVGMHNAVAHALAGKANPERAGWAALVRRAWLYCGGVEDNPLLPPVENAPQLIEFEPLWGVGMRELQATEGAEAQRELLDDLHSMFARLGHEDRYRALLESGPIRTFVEPGAEGEAKLGLMVEYLQAEIIKRHPFGASPTDSSWSGGMAGATVTQFLANGQVSTALRFAQQYLETAIEAADFIAAFAFGKDAIPAFCEVEAFESALSVASRLTELFPQPDVSRQLQRVDARMTVSFWNESGNLMRYVGQAENALNCYKIARGFLTLVNDEAGSASDASVLDRNEGLALRDLGRFAEAMPRIVAAADARPKDSRSQISLALLHLQTGRFAQAEAAADIAVAVSDRVAAPLDRVRALAVRAQVRGMLGSAAAALTDLSDALATAPESASATRVRIAATVSQIRGARLYAPNFVAAAEGLLRDAVEAGAEIAYQRSRDLPTAIGSLGLLLVDEGRNAELDTFDRAYLSPFLAALDDGVRIDWRLLRLKGLIERRRAGKWTEAAWNWFVRAVAKIETDIPAGSDAQFTGGWLADKDAFQFEFMDAAVAMVEQGVIPTTDLLLAYEFANGRELTTALRARSGSQAHNVDAGAALSAVARHMGRHILLLALLDTPEEVHVASLLTADGTSMLHGSWPAAQVEAGALAFVRTIDFTNPANPDAAAERIAPWKDLLTQLGAAIDARLPPGALVAILPGRRMTNLPLHLTPLPDERGELVLNHPVIFAPNLALLLDAPSPRPAESGQDALVVAVAKHNDSREFRGRLAVSARRITSDLGGVRRARHLSGRRATRDHVLASLATTDTLFLLCHGARIGRRRGYGIYLSDGLDLPPAVAVDVEDAPEVSRFALTWDELASLERTPSLIVSLACSSARTLVGSGGVRTGPEAAAFARDTRAVIAPLWNVEQTAALAWMQRFQAARARPDSKPLPVYDAYRQACLDVRAEWPNPFFWGPFMLSGRLMGQPIEEQTNA